jgi:YD repeat-containing protein
LSQTGDQKTLTDYNSRNQPVRITDSLGHETHLEYNTHFVNAFGQNVLQTTTTDPQGYRIVETYDAKDHLIEKTRLNPFGQKVASQTFNYDLCGNEIKTEVEVIEEGKHSRTITTLFQYNAVNELIKTIEAAGTPEQKVTSIRYNPFGQKEALIKPDGKEIHYTYDRFGRLESLTAPDVSYRYEYNGLDQVIRVVNLNTGKETSREYFQADLVRETPENGLDVGYTYDLTGRARTLIFPDQTALEYVYNAVDLKEIRRIIDGKIAYTHTLIVSTPFRGKC